MLDNGKIFVRVDIRIAVSRKMFSDRQNFIVLHAHHIQQTSSSNAEFIIAKRSIVDDGIIRVAVHVDIRREVDMHAEAMHLA